MKLKRSNNNVIRIRFGIKIRRFAQCSDHIIHIQIRT